MNRKVKSRGAQPWSQLQQYEIRFKGHLSSYRAQILEGMEMVQGPGGETVLTGPVIDQAATVAGRLDRAYPNPTSLDRTGGVPSSLISQPLRRGF